MDNTRKLSGHLPWVVGILLLLLGLFAFGVIGQKAWNEKAELTRRFEQCMESAPFKTSLRVPRPETVLSAEELQSHFDEFDQIFTETGLPPIWNGNALIEWKVYHKDSIEVARRCHSNLGIDQPQKQLNGTYSKPVWDPGSEIWTSS